MRLIIYFIILLLPTIAFSQKKTVINFNAAPAAEAFIVLEKKYDVKISFADSILNNKQITYAKKSSTLAEVLDDISEKLSIDFEFIDKRYIVATQGKANLSLPKKLAEVVITGYLTNGIVKSKDASFTLKPKQLGVLPGLIEADVLESIQELPGVISPTETATDLMVRGGNPDGNQVIWDGINIYQNGHLFGMISAFNPNITQNVTFINKGTNPKYGDRVSSVIDITTDNTIAKKANVSLGLNGISGDAFLNAPLVKDKLSLMLSYRRSYEGLFETTTFEKMERKIFQTTKIFDEGTSEESIYFRDYNIKLNYLLNQNNFLSASFIHIDNDLEHNDRLNDDESFKDILDTENNGLSLKWDKKWSDKVNLSTKLSSSKYLLKYNFIQSEDGEPLSDFRKDNKINDTDFSTELSIKANKTNKISLGYQLSNKRVDYAFTETKNTSSILDNDQATINTHSLYSNYSLRNLKSFGFELGFRTNYYKELSSFKFEPRLLVIKNITDYLKIQATAEIKNQIISQIEETVFSDLPLENKLWRLSDNSSNSPIINSKQVSLGLIYQKNGWSFDIDSYLKNVNGISSLYLGFLNSNLNKFNNGEQKITGTDFYLKKDFEKIGIWTSYSFTKITDQFNGVNNNQPFTSSNQIRNALSISTSYKIKQLQIALGWKWHSGKPFSIAQTNPSNGDIFFTGINTGTLPNYQRLDISMIYNFNISKIDGIKGKFGFSVRNLLNNNNQLSKEYLSNGSATNAIVIVDKYSLSLIPNFTFRIFW